MIYCFFFFFSSRRRHTRWTGDWSSDVCSSDLTIAKDQALLELETEKATIEVPSPVSGVVKELQVEEGRKVKVGDALFTVEENGAAGKSKPQERQEGSTEEPTGKERQAAPAAPQRTGRATVPAGGAAAAQPRKIELEKNAEPRPESAPQESAESRTAPKPEKREAQKTEPKSAR